VVLGAKVGCSLGLVVYWFFFFAMDFPFVSKKRNMMGGQLGLYKFSLYSRGKDATIKKFKL